MSKAAFSVVCFGSYIFLSGLFLLFAPSAFLSTALGSAVDVWIRVLGALIVVLGFYYVLMGRAEVTAFFKATIWGRAWIFGSFLTIFLLGIGKPTLVALGSLDLLGALWTWCALKKDAGTCSIEQNKH